MSGGNSLAGFEALEWDRLLELAVLEARSEPAKHILDQLYEPSAWAKTIQEATLKQQETQETSFLLDRDALWAPLTELTDCTPELDRLARGAVLELSELVMIRRWLFAIDSWTQIPRDEIKFDQFKKSLLKLPDPTHPLKILNKILGPDGELLEKASLKYFTLTQEIRSIKREIEITLERLLKTYSSQGILQENYSDLRDGRYVLPIKIAFQNTLEGNTYEASASRQTAFFEPKEVAELNNRLIQKKNEILQEIYLILEATSKSIREFVPEICLALDILSYWDAVHAKAKVARKYSGKLILVSAERHFSLRQTAHPLLWWTLPPYSIIRNDLEFGDPIRAMLISGPNTGGKTVLLKTLGLAGICARTGFPFPAVDYPTVPFFDSIFADVGDAQSIEEHLSSFAGHVLRFKEILEHLTPLSLILLDELNSATDPEEGAALGRAILEAFIDRAMVVSTTHDPYLKALSVTHPKIAVASMAFDDTSREPTFKMIQGVVGRSRALQTAARLGIPDSIIQQAQTYLSQGHLEFEKVLRTLEQDLEESTRKRKEASALLHEAEQLKKAWTQKSEESLSLILERVRGRLKRITEQAQHDVSALIKKVSEQASTPVVNQTRLDLTEALKKAGIELDYALKEEAPELLKELPQFDQKILASIPTQITQLEIGMKVRIPKWKTSGIILEILGTKIKVSMGNVQIVLVPNEVEPFTAPTLKNPTKAQNQK